ncbi:MAG: alpha-1,2-fucosyltransferase [Prevotella ruminicola]|jgi:hypothetical protein|uniref:Alpha-1,2-fucosyltransferase n=1 Tax=Xylanibacter ruminicola TaxID=839 RepID=A0A9D5P2T9_XYLRU|nr:alpha-1,2-fucosyltransferase [Xylanibacter ruminicola]
MRIVKVLGGLGNQMFQFALYKALQKQHPEERVLLDLHCFNGYHKHRGYEIGSVFGANYEDATLKEIARLAYPYPNYQCWRIGSRVLPVRKTMLKEKANFTFEPSALSRPACTYYDGYWQHEEYFKHIRQELFATFTFPTFDDERNQTTAQLATSTNSCSIHIRRGDYLTDPLRKGTTNGNYVIAAIQKMKQEVKPEKWLVFSDDIAWCQQHLVSTLNATNTIFVDWNTGANSIHDMHLMGLCRHHIIANSSFSWWGAWLSQQEGTTIAPANWMNLKDVCSPVPDNWIKI